MSLFLYKKKILLNRTKAMMKSVVSMNSAIRVKTNKENLFCM